MSSRALLRCRELALSPAALRSVRHVSGMKCDMGTITRLYFSPRIRQSTCFTGQRHELPVTDKEPTNFSPPFLEWLDGFKQMPRARSKALLENWNLLVVGPAVDLA